MKFRTLLLMMLVVSLAVGLLWLMWEFITPDVRPSKNVSAKELAASAEGESSLPEPEIGSAPLGDLNNAAVSDTTEVAVEETDVTPEAPPPPSTPTPDAVLNVPLEEAEHHVFTVGFTYEVTITQFHRVLDSKGQRTVEFVDMKVWQSTLPYKMTGTIGMPLTRFSPQDQQYIRNWARQQAAAAVANQTAHAQEP